MEEEKRKILKIEIEGINEDLFYELRTKLMEICNKLLDSVIDYETGATVKEEVKKIASLSLDFTKSKLKKASIENDKLTAEIQEKFALVEKIKAETRKENAIAETIEFDQSLKKMKFSLLVYKALIMGKKGEEVIIYTQQIDIFLEAINSILADKNLLN